jgi:hypothetical protein
MAKKRTDRVCELEGGGIMENIATVSIRKTHDETLGKAVFEGLASAVMELR